MEEDRPGKGSMELLLRLPVVHDVSISAAGDEVALATGHGAVVADLERSGDRSELRWWRAGGPELGPGASRVAFGRVARARRRLAVASGRSFRIVDLEAGGAAGLSDSNLGSSVGKSTAPFSAHLRPINALDWSWHSPDRLVTCAEDCRFFVWDLRQQQPAQSLLAPASWTSSVKWAPLNDVMLATGHADSICIWDIRSSTQHMSVLAPGQARVLGVDWSPRNKDRLLSVSMEHTPTKKSGAIKVWDVSSAGKVHDSIDIEDGCPYDARFLPFGGPAILASVESSVVVFQLEGGSARRAKVVQTFDGHAGPVSSLGFAPIDGENSAEWRIVTFSAAERCLRSWKYELSRDFQATLAEARESPDVAGLPVRSSVLSDQRTPSHTSSPSIGPLSSPQFTRIPSVDAGGGDTDEAQFLEYLEKQAELLREVACVDEVQIFREYQRGVEYQLLIEVTADVDIGLWITVKVDPAASTTRMAMAAVKGSAADLGAPVPDAPTGAGQGLRIEISWADEWAATLDGPLAPGVIEETFRSLSITDLLRGGPKLCACVKALVRMLRRRDGAPRLDDEDDEALQGHWTMGPSTPKALRSGRRRSSRMSCGMYRSPEGDLHCFRSLQRSKVTREDLRWTAPRPPYIFEPTPSHPLPADICRRNSEMAAQIGREDLAEIWRMVGILMREENEDGICARPFGTCLVRLVLQQLFDAQETVTLALVGAVLLGGTSSSGAKSFADAGAQRRTVRLKGQRHQQPRQKDWGKVERRPPARDWKERGSLTWSPSVPGQQELADLGRRAAAPLRDERSVADFLASVQYNRGQTDWPRSADATLSGLSNDGQLMPAVVSAPSELGAEKDSGSPRPKSRIPRIIPSPAPGSGLRGDEAPPPQGLVPRDEGTIEQLLHSAHVYCLEYSQEYCSSRALAKLMQGLRTKNNKLPLLDAEDRFGAFRVIEDRHWKCELLFQPPGRPEGSGSPLQPPPAGGLRSPMAMVRSSPEASPALRPQPSPRLGSPQQRPASPVRHLQIPEIGLGPPAFPPAFGSLEPGPGSRETFALERRPSGGQGQASRAATKELGACAAPACSVCCLRVRNLFTPCWSCGHGFHIACFREWFTDPSQKCPTIGCECLCLQQRPDN